MICCDFGVTKAKNLRIREDPFLGTVFLLPGVATMAWISVFCGVVRARELFM